MKIFDNNYNNWIKSLKHFIYSGNINNSSKTMDLLDDLKIFNKVCELHRPLTAIEVNKIINN